MALVKVNCTKCVGAGLVGVAVITTCPDCGGTGTLTVNDASTLNSLNQQVATPFVVVTPNEESKGVESIDSINY